MPVEFRFFSFFCMIIFAFFAFDALRVKRKLLFSSFMLSYFLLSCFSLLLSFSFVVLFCSFTVCSLCNVQPLSCLLAKENRQKVEGSKRTEKGS